MHHSRPPPVVERLENGETLPTCVLIVGMAGSGKTTLMHRLNQEDRTYCVNLDPAVLDVPYDVDIDIRDTVNYKSVMKFHKLGPNGAIMTSLNLFSTKFDQVITLLEKRAFATETKTEPTEEGSTEENTTIDVPKESSAPKEDVVTVGDEEESTSDEDGGPMKYILVDTPGQIEAFTWSASGSIISESLASRYVKTVRRLCLSMASSSHLISFPTVMVFVVDTARCASSPNTFMSNMLYACSMLYRTKLPLVVCFNKTDVVSHDFCMEWMRDYEKFQEALDNMENAGFYGSLTRSLSMVLDEFYSNFANAVGVSAVTGDGIDQFWATVRKAATQDFATDYIQDLKDRIEEQEARTKAIARLNVKKIQRDIEADGLK